MFWFGLSCFLAAWVIAPWLNRAHANVLIDVAVLLMSLFVIAYVAARLTSRRKGP